mmetsp:Transcript_103399/g.316436  ORF Transcript_103399/g.316436 Transcript_103399/m.316436 type:complete len:204 (-) Transcript_103399:1435-2046(-)
MLLALGLPPCRQLLQVQLVRMRQEVGRETQQTHEAGFVNTWAGQQQAHLGFHDVCFRQRSRAQEKGNRPRAVVPRVGEPRRTGIHDLGFLRLFDLFLRPGRGLRVLDAGDSRLRCRDPVFVEPPQDADGLVAHGRGRPREAVPRNAAVLLGHIPRRAQQRAPDPRLGRAEDAADQPRALGVAVAEEEEPQHLHGWHRHARRGL